MPVFLFTGAGPWLLLLFVLVAANCNAQVDPNWRSMLQFGYDQPLKGESPPGTYGFFYYNDPDFFRTNTALRLVLSPVYLDSEIGFRHVIWPYTDIGIGISGGGYGDDYYEVRQGQYLKSQSFYGDGGGLSFSLYQRLNPGMKIPLSFIGRGGFRYSTFATEDQTSPNFILPGDQEDLFARAGLRLAGKEPVLYPNLAMELSVWYERTWRLNSQTYGFNGDRRVNPGVDLYWLYAGMTYSFAKTAQTLSLAVTAGGSTDADRLSAWRLGGMLPFSAEYPLMIPGYFNQELTAERFVHLYGYYEFPLVPGRYLKFRLEGAVANLEYLPGFEQGPWQSGVGCALIFAPRKRHFKVELRYGYGFQALRHGEEGGQSVGVLIQYDFERRNKDER